MAGEPRLRAVSEGEASARPPAARPARERRWPTVALAAALVLALALLLWSRVELGQRIAGLEDEVSALETTLAERERLIDAQQRRISSVRERVAELQVLLDAPLSEPE